ncbi:hypothetical protein BV379_00780 [Rhodovulum sulfidophilum]|nr:hypothetical protein BV379_00780 [Rhodovulum sulfidophilum]
MEEARQITPLCPDQLALEIRQRDLRCRTTSYARIISRSASVRSAFRPVRSAESPSITQAAACVTLGAVAAAFAPADKTVSPEIRTMQTEPVRW